jgi:hypothetical protein
VNTTNRPGRSVAGTRDRGRGMALTHTVLIVAQPAGVEFHLDHRVDAARGQHRVVGPEGLAAWLADAGGVPAAFRVVASCPCRRVYMDGVPGIGPDQAVRGDGPSRRAWPSRQHVERPPGPQSDWRRQGGA